MTSTPMTCLKAIVKNGRLTLDEPTNLPEGTVVELEEHDPYTHLDGSELDATDRAKLNAAIARGIAQGRAGLELPADEVLNELERP